MAGEWIKMRTSLLTNPKVNGIARILENSVEVADVLTTGYSGTMSQIVTRNVMRHVTVSSLIVIWGSANEHTKDGIFSNADFSDIDDMVGIPGFADAMESVGWLIYDKENHSVILPNFNEYNTSSDVRTAGAKSAAQRQKEYRQRLKEQNSYVTRDVTDNVTSDVTRNRREEKSRVDINTSIPDGIDCPQPSAEDKPDSCPHQEIIALYAKHLPMGIQPRTWTGSRATALKTRWREDKKRQSLAWWERFFAYIATSPFLTGKVYDAHRKPFEITLEWIVTPKNFAKIIDGNYHSKEASNA